MSYVLRLGGVEPQDRRPHQRHQPLLAACGWKSDYGASVTEIVAVPSGAAGTPVPLEFTHFLSEEVRLTPENKG